ncbi:flagellar assembly protein FliX [Hansschlegelia zhihuaiae]|uniref:Flagellar assembly regulator FliX n=1 Tax=Hansschlegelia zhihuaiae TaxID=405005 RepID=A0A4Q0M590_9HYPH|nr:hypothetical protein EK403_20535 [Hansschlegelia zhihuaiae]
MRIDGLGRAIGGGPQRAGATRGAFFQLSDPGTSAAARAPSPLRQSPGLDALIALQAVETELPRERRKREIARGRSLLDALDGMKLALVGGQDDDAALGALAAQLSEARGATGEIGLDDALAAIELRAQVEMAKRGR